MPNTYASYYSQLFPPTAKAPPYPGTSLQPAIQGLITPGLVPDIARQSAEVSAGRGVAGSPAGDSTAVRMSEQNYLQRLALANSLLSGQASRDLPYQITPFQSQQLGLQWENLQNQLKIAGQRYPGGGGGGGGGQKPAPGAAPSPWGGFMGSPWGAGTDTAARGTRPDSFGTGGGILGEGGGGQPIFPGGPAFGDANSLDDMDAWFDWNGSGTSGGTGGDPTTDTPYDWSTLNLGE